jgi:hypothetical protein
VKLDDAFDETQSDPATRLFERLIRPNEQVEDVGKEIRTYAYAIIFDPDDGVRGVAFDRHHDPSTTAAVFGGVIEQIDKDLSEPRRIRIHVNG